MRSCRAEVINMRLIETKKAYIYRRECDRRYSESQKVKYTIEDGIEAVFAKQNSGRYVLCSLTFSKKEFDYHGAQLYWESMDVRLLTKEQDWNRKIPLAHFIIDVGNGFFLVVCGKNLPKYETLGKQYTEMVIIDDEEYIEDECDVARHPDIKEYDKNNQYICTLMNIYDHTDDSLIKGLAILNATTLAQEGRSPEEFVDRFGPEIVEFHKFFCDHFYTDSFGDKMIYHWGDLPRILRIGLSLRTTDITDEMVHEAEEHLSDTQKRNARKLAEYFLRDKEHLRYLTTIFYQRIFHHQFGPGCGSNDKNELTWLAVNLVHHGEGCIFRTVLSDDCHIINGFLFRKGKPERIPVKELKEIMERQPDGTMIEHPEEKYQEAFLVFE